MVTVQQVKNYLQIPFSTDDTLIQETVLDSGYVYLEGAVTDFRSFYAEREDFVKLADTWVLTQWAPTFYDQREGLTTKGGEINGVARAMLMQLQYYV